MKQRMYLCIDLKSFYASVECVERGLDPMITNLVVADPDRSDKTICLAITPAMKRLGVKNRCRVFEIPPGIDYIMAPPRMQTYINYSAEIYGIYLKYIAKEDIHVYSIDEAFLDVTDYLSLYQMTARELGQRIMGDIYTSLGIRATCGIGPNLYLTKIALDITAKHSPDFIGELTEESYCRTLWHHRPLTDFWQIGSGKMRTLAKYGIHTMGDIAHADEDFLYRLFGVDAELLIDHAWGREPVTMKEIKSYHSSSHSLSNGQVLMRDYEFEEGVLIVKEMMDLLALDLVKAGLVTDSVTLHVCYSNALLIPASHGSIRLPEETSSDLLLVPAAEQLYRQIVNPAFPIRRVFLTCNQVTPREFSQYNLFLNTEKLTQNHAMQKTVLEIQQRFGKNAILKGMNYQAGAMTRERNEQIGGHKKDWMAASHDSASQTSSGKSAKKNRFFKEDFNDAQTTAHKNDPAEQGQTISALRRFERL